MMIEIMLSLWKRVVVINSHRIAITQQVFNVCIKIVILAGMFKYNSRRVRLLPFVAVLVIGEV